MIDKASDKSSPSQDSNTLDYLAESIRGAWQRPFRGEIFEYARKLDLQNGYAVKGNFDINSARHLIMPLRAIRELAVLLVSIMGAVQTLKSLITDLCAPFWTEHDAGDTLILFEDDPKAKLYAETRAMPLIRSVPEIMALFEGMDRNDKTKTAIKFRHMNLAYAGLNLGNVQSISWRRVIVDEGWMHKNDGLIRQAKDRTKQYPDTKKIVLLGQGGMEDDDAHLEHKQTVQYDLHYQCPKCGGYQPFEINRQRPDDFKIQKLRGTYAGLSWDSNDSTRPAGRWDYDEVWRSAHHRCYYCNYRIEDEPDVRRALNDSYKYFLEGKEPTPATELLGPLGPGFSKSMGFHWPGEASTRVPFGEMAVKYLRAKISAEELSYRLPLIEFYQKDRGRAWSDTFEAEYRAAVREDYDVNKEWEEEKFRILIADCQKDLKRFHCSVYAMALTGEARELARVTVESFDAIAKLQTAWKVKDQRVFLDCGYQMTKVLRECVKRGHVGKVKVGGQVKQVWLCWTGLKGSGVELFCHKNPRTQLKEYKLFSERKFYNVNVGTKDRHPKAPWYEWSNLHCKDLMRDRRDGDPSAPKFLFLPDTLPAADPWSHFSQMRSEKRIEIWTPRGKRAIWQLVKETRPNHEWDKANMCIAFQGIVGIIGAPEEGEEPKAQTPN